MAFKCEGLCNDLTSEGCRGTIKTVIVNQGITNNYQCKNWEFDYCDNAIETDRKNGFRVKIKTTPQEDR